MKAVIVDWLRSPFHRAHKGKLANVRPDEMAGQVIRELMKRNNLSGSMIDDLILGCAYPEGEQGYNLGRLLTFLGDLPNTVPGATINRLCGSSMQAILSAAAHIEVGWGDCILVGGVESMSRVQRRGFNWSPSSELEDKFPDAYIGMGQTAENVAKAWNQTRLQHEEFALLSHQKAASAQSNGLLANEIVSIQSDDGIISEDGCIRGNTNLESMAKLNPAFGDDGLVTAATSSPLTDGAVFMVVCSEDFAEKNNLKPIARIVAGAVTGCAPDVMGIGPIEAIKKVLKRANWDIDDVDLFELNEAFSSQSLAVIDDLQINPEIVNLHGGALAIGHPLGASGARITGKAASLLQSTNSKRAIATMCIGGGMGISIALEKM
ncbi:MAG: thiolase family protein [Candidatus Thalassarchaeaceae archaeon]|nr:thiolase family protein [Candidatus Thalassarchaeaceae archaeon]|tara:strand:- start:495 stop:1628 length:1134 start_codon:yes stop_codon:yes gene_type:complete